MKKQSTKNTNPSKKKLALGKGIASLLNAPDDEFGFNMDQMKQNLKGQVEKSRGEKDGTNSKGKESIIKEQTSVPLSLLQVNPYQPRKIFKEKDLDELAASIKENGLIQPIVVSERDGEGFEIISGERRFRACQKIGLEYVPVFVKKATDKDRLVLAIIENVQRSDLNCVEEALAYYQLMDEFKLTQEEVAKKIGKERSTIANFLRLLKLPREVVDMLQKDLLSFGHGKIIAGVKDQDQARKVAKESLENGLSVRQTEELIKKLNKDKKETNKEENPYELLTREMETSTGLHVNIKGKKNGKGSIQLNFSSKEEFNRIYEHVLKFR